MFYIKHQSRSSVYLINHVFLVIIFLNEKRKNDCLGDDQIREKTYSLYHSPKTRPSFYTPYLNINCRWILFYNLHVVIGLYQKCRGYSWVKQSLKGIEKPLNLDLEIVVFMPACVHATEIQKIMILLVVRKYWQWQHLCDSSVLFWVRSIAF